MLIYSDFQCPSCARLAPVLASLLAKHPADLQIIFRPYPLWPIHDKALLAAEAAEAAGVQGYFWEMHDLLFAGADEWVSLSPEDFLRWVEHAARSLPLDQPRFETAMRERAFLTQAEQDFNTGLASGIAGTPFLFLNGAYVPLPPTINNLEALIRLDLLEYKGLPTGPPVTADPEKAYRAVLHTTAGEIGIRLFPDSAPQAVGSFLYLAALGWFDGTSFHRVLPGALAETGDPSHTGLGGPAYRFENEIDSDRSFAEIGMVGLRNDGPGSNGSLFFVNLRPLPDLDGTHTIFGRIDSGLDLIQSLPARDPLEDLLEEPPLIIERVTIEESDS